MIARIPAIKGVKYRHNSEGFSLQAGILTTLEPALLLMALCLAALGAYALPGRRGYLGGRRALPLSAETARWHDAGEVESASGDGGGGAMRAGIPLERQAAVALGNRTAVEGGAVEAQGGLAAEQRGWDAGIVKTTDVVTYSQDDLAKVSIYRANWSESNSCRLRGLVLWSRDSHLALSLHLLTGAAGLGGPSSNRARRVLAFEMRH
jgi:hypothetical protein